MTIIDIQTKIQERDQKVVNVVINEQHTLLPDQERIIKEAGYDKIDFIKVSADGWDKSQMDDFINSYNYRNDIVFVSPIGYMIKHVSSLMALKTMNNIQCGEVLVMCNDNRDKKELPNGKIISVVAKEGWYLG